MKKPRQIKEGKKTRSTVMDTVMFFSNFGFKKFQADWKWHFLFWSIYLKGSITKLSSGSSFWAFNMPAEVLRTLGKTLKRSCVLNHSDLDWGLKKSKRSPFLRTIWKHLHVPLMRGRDVVQWQCLLRRLSGFDPGMALLLHKVENSTRVLVTQTTAGQYHPLLYKRLSRIIRSIW